MSMVLQKKLFLIQKTFRRFKKRMKAGVYLISNNVKDGVVYNSIKEASEKTKVKYNTIQRRLKNPNFPNYFYIKYPNKNVDI